VHIVAEGFPSQERAEIQTKVSAVPIALRLFVAFFKKKDPNFARLQMQGLGGGALRKCCSEKTYP
jgi:hypothetical protein